MEKLKAGRCGSIFPSERWGAIPIYLLAFIAISCQGLPFREAGPSGVYHRVKSGETLSAIAKAYHADLQNLAEVNNIMNPSLLEKDSVIFIPHAQEVIDEIEIISRSREKKGKIAVDDSAVEKNGAPASNAAEKRNAGKKVGVDQKKGRQAARSVFRQETIYPSQKAARESSLPQDSGKGTGADGVAKQMKTLEKNEKQGQVSFNKSMFIWPLRGKVVSFFGVQPSGMFFNGIRIAALEGAAVAAAGDGIVIHSAFLKYYGETVIIQHADDYASVYANLEVRVAGLNARVKKGDRIGSIGNVSGKGDASLHFEIRNKNKARNPLFFLP